MQIGHTVTSVEKPPVWLKIAADNLFNSVKTCTDVEREHKVCLFGTLRSSKGQPEALVRENNPQFTAKKDRIIQKKGDFHFIRSIDSNLAIFTWLDSDFCQAISTFHECKTPEEEGQCYRRVKGMIEKQLRKCPQIFKDYNEWMGGVDDVDRLFSFLSTRLRGRKWWHVLFYFSLDVISIDAFTLWKLDNPDRAKSTPRRVWTAMVVDEILAEYGDRYTDSQTEVSGVASTAKIQMPKPVATTSLPIKRTAHGNPVPESACKSSKRLQGYHFPMQVKGKQGNCALCSVNCPGKDGQIRVGFYCEDCELWFHLPCFKEWHTNPTPVSQILQGQFCTRKLSCSHVTG